MTVITAHNASQADLIQVLLDPATSETVKAGILANLDTLFN